MKTSAHISHDGRYRYDLTREWGNGMWEGPGPTIHVLFVMLNPSKADATVDDPTIRKCIGFAERWGYGGITVVNLFAYRSTDPRKLGSLSADERVGPLNDAVIKETVTNLYGTVVAAWGSLTPRWARERAEKVLLMLGMKVKCLRKTKDGQPGHPLYAPYMDLADLKALLP